MQYIWSIKNQGKSRKYSFLMTNKKRKINGSKYFIQRKKILGVVVSKSPPSIPLWRNSLLILQNNLANKEFAGL